ncbi:acyl carrier protein [Embleya scabrispora]|uniref:acyl carrier protein n=1 Tax=Embleya scabrispora TaxID=159449 RepID=UPI0003A1233D|nr:acyl carrier protein [Embleya scabrispora]MYS80783.1 acyl carrier protein [Streptomyces sp. SID5474]
MRDIADQVRTFIVEDLGWEGPRAELTDDLPLIEKGVLDSLGLLSLVTHLEDRLGIRVEDRDMVPDNLGTLRNIDRFVAQKLEAARDRNTPATR